MSVCKNSLSPISAGKSPIGTQRTCRNLRFDVDNGSKPDMRCGRMERVPLSGPRLSYYAPSLIRRGVVERSVLVHDVDSDVFEGRVAENFYTSVRDVALIDRGCSSRKVDLFAIRCLDHGTLQHIKCFLAVMDVKRNGLARLILHDRNDDLHVRPR